MIVYNNEIIENAIMDAFDKKEKGIEIDRNELINVILKGDRDFGIKNGNRKYTKEELQYSIYIHINNKNNKCYIGQTIQMPKDRWGYNGICYKTQAFYNTIKKYGWDNISHVVICYGLSKEEANDMEILLISIFKSTNGNFGYNVENGGNTVGKMSEETKEKLRKFHTGKQLSEETRKKLSEAKKGEKHYLYGKHLSEEHKEKLRESHKGLQSGEKHPLYNKHHSEETVEKMREAHKGKYEGENNHMYGKRHSEETRKKMSEARKGENNPSAKKIFYNGMIFPTVTECAKFCNVSRVTMNNWLKEKYKTPSKLLSELLKKGFRYATEEDINTYPLYKEEQNQQDQ